MSQAEATLERIRIDGPVKNSIHNLIQTLSIKLDSAARYGLYIEDAHADGYEDCAELFGRLADQVTEALLFETPRHGPSPACTSEREPALLSARPTLTNVSVRVGEALE